MTNLNLLLIITTPYCTFSVARACLVISPVQVWISPSGATRFRVKGIGFSPFYTAFHHRSQLCNVSSFTTTQRSSSSTLTLFILARFIRVSVFPDCQLLTFITASPRVYGYLSLERFLLVVKILRKEGRLLSPLLSKGYPRHE